MRNSDHQLLERIRALYAEIAVFQPVVDAAAKKRDDLVAERTGIPNSQFRSDAEARLYCSHLGPLTQKAG